MKNNKQKEHKNEPTLEYDDDCVGGMRIVAFGCLTLIAVLVTSLVVLLWYLL